MVQRGNKLTISLAALSLMIGAGGSAIAQTDVRLGMEQAGEVSRIEIIYPEELGGNLQVEADIIAGAVLQARFSEPIRADAEQLVDAFPGLVARARIDTDGSVLRVALNQEVEPRISISHNMVAIDLAAPGTAPLADIISPYERNQQRLEAERLQEEARLAAIAATPLPPLPVVVNYGEASEYTRIEFNWSEQMGYDLDQSGAQATLTFDRTGDADLSELLGRDIRLTTGISNESDDDNFRLVFDLEEGVEARVWDEGARVVLDLMDPLSSSTNQVLAALNQFAATQNASAETGIEEEPVATQVEDEVHDTGEVSATEDGRPRSLQPELDPDSQSDIEPESGRENESDPVPVNDRVSSDADDGVENTERTDPETDSDEDLPVLASEEYVDPVPEDGIVLGETRLNEGDVSVTFEWEALPGAALFRRGDAVWLVFDASAALMVESPDNAVRRRIQDVEAWRGDTYAAIRFVIDTTTQTDISAEGSAWTVTFTDVLPRPPEQIPIVRETPPREPARIDLTMDQIRSIVDFVDPLVGDRLWVITADGHKRGVITSRRFLEAAFLPSAHGVAIQKLADDLSISQTPHGARLSRPGGLALTRPLDQEEDDVAVVAVSSSGFDFEAWRGENGYLEDRQTLTRQASSLDPGALTSLAQFYLAWGLTLEALGTMDLITETRPRMANDPRLNAMRGVASYMMARHQDARRYLTVPQLINEPATQPWLGLVAASQSNWAEARRRFSASGDGMYYLDDLWRERVRVTHARASLEANDLAGAESLLLEIDETITDPQTVAEAAFISARLAAERGDIEEALAAYEALGQSEWVPIQARALLEKIRLEFAEGTMTPTEGADQLESLRYRWRGDDTEIEASRLLGELYAEAGRYPEALNILNLARMRDPGSPISRGINDDMHAMFRRLFLDQEADRMDPLVAVGLWYEYSDLTPQGEEGQRMVRRIAERLVAIDLLEPAADLLDHQVFELTSINGFAKAQIAADLAIIYLMDDRDEEALRALQRTRIAGLPREIVDERRLLEARAMAGLGRQDHALELISNDTSPEADRLRADIAWERQEWSQAGRRLESILGDRWQSEAPLNASESHDVLRSAIAFTLAGDTTSVERLGGRYADAMANSRFASAFSLVTSDISSRRDARLVDLVEELGQMESVDSFMRGFTERFIPEAGS